MRFPWLQVDTDFIDGRAAELGARLGVSRREAAGLALDLWKWVLSRSPDDKPPEGHLSGSGAVPVLIGVLGWAGDHDHLMSALVAVGLVEILPTGLRVRGLSRYRTTWEKNRRRTTGTKPERSRTGAGAEPEPKTQTYTQKETTTLAAPADAAPLASGQEALFAEQPKPSAAKPEKAKKPKPEPTGDPRHHPLKLALCAEEFRYTFRGGHDAKAVSDLLRLADSYPPTSGELAHAEIIRRWRICRTWVGYPSSPHLAAFATNWNAYADPQGASSHKPAAGGAIPAHLMRKAETHREALLALPEGELPIPD